MTSPSTLAYLAGFHNHLASEAIPGALPPRSNTPRKAPFGLVPELLAGSEPGASRAEAARTWLYRLRPSTASQPTTPYSQPRFALAPGDQVAPPEPLRFNPFPLPDRPADLIDGLTTLASAGDPTLSVGAALHLYTANADMTHRALVNHDGHLILVPEAGSLLLRTELGLLHVHPGELALIPRGVAFAATLPERRARGFVAESFGAPFTLPEPGLIGPSSLADPRHFLTPTAAFEDKGGSFVRITRHRGRLFQTPSNHSPFDVVAWHGNLVPFKYDLRLFNSLGSVSFDQPDPSLYTVLAAPAPGGGPAMQLAVFLGRWEVAEGTFRPPPFRRDMTSQLYATLLAPNSGGPFPQGAFTFTPRLAPHGPSARKYNAALSATDADADKPRRGDARAAWLLLDSAFALEPTPWLIDHPQRDADLLKAFHGYKYAELPPVKKS